MTRAVIASPAGRSGSRRAGDWLEDPGFGVYVHIPFCRHRCHYCDFNTYEALDALHAPYVDALVRHIESWSGPVRPATSVFFGGGTPTLLAPASLGRILGAVAGRCGLSPGAELTVEANPETVDRSIFSQLLEVGFNRFSIGVQSTEARVLAALGRTHSSERALEAIAEARRAGVEDVNADLIYGSPWESPDDWRATLERIVEAGTDHISAYALTVEEGTPLHTLVVTGRAPDVDPDVQADRFYIAEELLAAAGFRRYEISNWCRDERASAHNLLYWSAGDYLGFGAGAHGHVSGRRWWCERLPRAFVAAAGRGDGVEAGHEVLTPDRRAGEALMLGLRLTGGVHLEGFARRFGSATVTRRSAAIGDLTRRGLVAEQDGRLRLAPGAALLANEVASALL